MTQELDQQLTEIKTAAASQSASYYMSRDQLHQAFVDAYLWWRDADKDHKYLASTYKAAGITTRKRQGNSPNFYPLVRLIWNIDASKHASTISNWARSLLALHEEYGNKPELYKHSPRADLINYIKDKGGLGALRGEKQLTAAQLAEEEEAGVAEEKRGRPKLEAPAYAAVTDAKIASLQAVKPKAVIGSFPTAVTNTDNLVVMLGRRNAAGQIEILGSDYSETLVQSALNACTTLDRSAVTPSLRLIAEALEPHALPAKLEKYRNKFFDDSSVERSSAATEDGVTLKAERVKEATRLRYRPATKDFLLSKAMAPASVVTYVRPHMEFGCDGEVIMRGEDRSWVERELLNQQKLTLYSATPDFGLLGGNQAGGKVRYELQIEDTAKQHGRTFYFYSKGSVPTETNVQASIKDTAFLAWDWELTATVQWLAEFDAQCATPYVNKIRGFFNKTKFASLQLQIGQSDVEVRYWLNEDEKSYAESYSIPYNGHANLQKAQDRAGLFTGNSKDLALVFAVLPTLPITSEHVLLSGNEHLMRIKYSTELADYETYIPAAELKGWRDATAFEMYGA
jgi:hypothetical protein